MLCIVCDAIFKGKGESFPPGEDAKECFHHKSLKALKEAAGHNCHLCNLLLRVLPSSVTTTDWAYEHFEGDTQPPKTLANRFFEDHVVGFTRSNIHTQQSSIASARNEDNARRIGKLHDEVLQMETHARALRILTEGDPNECHNTLIYHFDDASTHKSIRMLKFFFVSPEGRMGLRTHTTEFALVLHVDHTPTFDESAVPDNSKRMSIINSASLRLARRWLHDCVHHHGNKCSSQDNSSWPTRLLYLPVDDALDGNTLVRLVEVPRKASVAPVYMTLSHQWGDPDKMLKMTPGNMVSFQAGVRLSQMPQTFRHAVRFAISCGIQHLWIDSMCIKQGDKEDWEREAARMADYYHNAFCNLSAADAQASAFGLFAGKDQWLAEPLVVSLDPVTWNVVDGPPDQRFICVPKTLWTSAVESAPVNSRGWVVQERLFSCRKIFFTNQQLFWECRTIKFCETFPREVPTVLYHHSQFSMVHHEYRTPDALVPLLEDLAQQRGSSDHDLPIPAQQRKNLLVAWGALLQRYTSCDLTHHSDRLIAISSLAAKVQAMLGGEYVYGLWKDELPFQLIFMYRNTMKSRKAIPEIYAPTWSWAYRRAKLSSVPQSRWKIHEDKISLLDIVEIRQYPNASITTPSGDQISMSATLICKCTIFVCRPDEEKTSASSSQFWRMKTNVGTQTIRVHTELEQDFPGRFRLSLIPVFRYDKIDRGGYALVVVQLPAEGVKVFMRVGCCRVPKEFILAFLEVLAIDSNVYEEAWLV